MPIMTSKFETSKLMSGEADGITRMYGRDVGCPYNVGDQTLIAVDAGGKPEPYAKATIISIRPCEYRARAKDERLNKMDGFESGPMWVSHFEKMYGEGTDDNMPLFRVQLKMEVMEK